MSLKDDISIRQNSLISKVSGTICNVEKNKNNQLLEIYPNYLKTIPRKNNLSDNFENNAQFSSHYDKTGKNEIKSQINQKNKSLQELNTNRQFFETQFPKKTEEFKSILKDIKPQIFDKIFKSTLHYIYKHYENFKNGVELSQAHEILQANLSKQRAEIEFLQKKNQEMLNENRLSEAHLLELSNKEGLIQRKLDVFDKMSKTEIEAKIMSTEKDNLELENKLNDIRRNKDNRLIKYQMKMEHKGRKEMEKRAIKIALGQTEEVDYEIITLKHNVEMLIKEIEFLQQFKNNNTYFQISKNKQALLDKINEIRLIS